MREYIAEKLEGIGLEEQKVKLFTTEQSNEREQLELEAKATLECLK